MAPRAATHVNAHPADHSSRVTSTPMERQPVTQLHVSHASHKCSGLGEMTEGPVAGNRYPAISSIQDYLGLHTLLALAHHTANPLVQPCTWGQLVQGMQ